MYDVKKIFSDETNLNRICVDGLTRRCVPECEMLSVLEAFHSSPIGGHHSWIRPLIRYYNVFTIGQLFIKMLMSSLKYVIDGKEMAAFQESKSSLSTPFL